ncbi:hypothetical protein PYCC9005_001535 [Savitreella phatthalungensis]
MERSLALLENSEDGDELLQRCYTKYTKPSTHIHLRPLLRKLSHAAGGGDNDAEARRDDAHKIIELHGKVGAGKTHLLYMLCMKAVVEGKAVVVIDTEIKFDFGRLLSLLEARLDGASGKHYLDQILVIMPQTSALCLAALQSLPERLAREMPDAIVAYTLVDSISAYHWNDNTSTGTLLKALHAACLKIGSAKGVVTSWDTGYTYMSLDQNLSTKLLVERKHVLPFQQGLAQAYSTAEARMDVIRRGTFYVKTTDEQRRVGFSIKNDSIGVL